MSCVQTDEWRNQVSDINKSFLFHFLFLPPSHISSNHLQPGETIMIITNCYRNAYKNASEDELWHEKKKPNKKRERPSFFNLLCYKRKEMLQILFSCSDRLNICLTNIYIYQVSFDLFRYLDSQEIFLFEMKSKVILNNLN